MATYRNVPADIYRSARARIVTMVMATAHVEGQWVTKHDAEHIATEILEELRGVEIVQFVRSFECKTLTQVTELINEWLKRGNPLRERTTGGSH